MTNSPRTPKTQAQLRSAAIQHMAHHDPALHSAMKRLESLPAFPAKGSAQSHFHSLARSILSQQLAGSAARTIHDRVKRLGVNGRFPTPGSFLRLDIERIRGCGVSSAKTAAIRELAQSIESGQLSLRGLAGRSDERIIKDLTTIRGIGIWTAQMFLIFRLGRLDVLPSGDLGVREGLRILDGLDERPTARELEARGEAWAPYRTFATWALYRVVDEHRDHNSASK
ncbi:MAG: DNA-3-methyladenine glycosylase [Phycisphaerae bacterium]|nr:DNA-3-methyladenine glycosylase [Phycisphaerae bacterium]HAW96430.1 DNA-3-methyladenine glycosylase 2 family protein [Phycisphaerales bacterium]